MATDGVSVGYLAWAGGKQSMGSFFKDEESGVGSEGEETEASSEDTESSDGDVEEESSDDEDDYDIEEDDDSSD